MITLGVSNVSCECGQRATCVWISVSFFSKGMATTRLFTVSMAAKAEIHGRVDDPCAWLDW